MSGYKTVLCHQSHEEEPCPLPSAVPSKIFATLDAFYMWLHEQMEEHQKRVASGSSSYTKKQIEFLDLVEGNIIDFLFELRHDYDIHWNLANFLDKIILPHIGKIDEIVDEDDSGLFDE